MPRYLNARWIDSLSDDQLASVESTLHSAFVRHERKERNLRGELYDLMRGPAPLLEAWTRWSMLNNATRARGLTTRARS